MTTSHEKTITVGGVDYDVHWDDDRTGNPDDITYTVYDCQGRCMGDVMRSFHTTSSYHAGSTYWRRGATKDWDIDTVGVMDDDIVEGLTDDQVGAFHDAVYTAFRNGFAANPPKWGATSTWLTIVKHFIKAFDEAMSSLSTVEAESIDWRDEELCCGILWSQVAAFSNHVKHCPCCGSALSYIPKGALE